MASAWVSEVATLGARFVLPQGREVITIHAPIEQVRGCEEKHGELARVGLVGREQAAWRRWQLGGGAKGERDRARREREARSRRALARLGAAFRAYMRQAGSAQVGMSGAALDEVGGCIHVEISRRSHRRGRRRGRDADGGGQQGDDGPRARRVRAHVDFQRGAAADGSGRWKVDRVLEVRRVGEWPRRRLEMRVRWAGVDPATHLPWADEWRPMTDESGAVPNPALNGEARRMEARKFGTRLAAPAPPPPPRIRRLNVRLRCENDEDENGGDAVRPPRRPRRPGVVIEEEPCAADGGRAMVMQRGSREEPSRREGRACEPGRAGERAGDGDGEASEGEACGGD